MLLEETSGDPLVDSHPDHLSESENSWLFILELLGLLNSLEEEGSEGLKRVLVHVSDNAQLNEQEVEHGTFGSDSSIDLSEGVDLDLSIFGNCLLCLNFHRCLLGDL